MTKDIISLNLSTTGFWIRILGKGFAIVYMERPLFSFRNKLQKHFRIGKIYIYYLGKN